MGLGLFDDIPAVDAPDLDALEKKYGLPPGLLVAIKGAENSGPDSVSPKGARGTFQFMPATAKAYGLDNPSDTGAAAEAAARYMADAAARYKTNDPRVLMAEFNGGPRQAQAVLAGGQPPAAETQRYIQKAPPSGKLGLFDDIPAGQQQPAQQDSYDPAGSFGENLAAGAGKAVVDTWRGLRQLGSYAGIGDPAAIQQEIDDAKRRDAALMRTGGGITGDIAGQVAMAVLPGGAAMRGAKVLEGAAPRLAGAIGGAGRAVVAPQTILGAGAGGAAQGFVQPVASDDSRLLNTGVGAVGGAAVPFAVNAASLPLKALAPFFQRGQENAAGRVLDRFATNPNSILSASGELVPGSVPTLAEATGDIGLAQLQRTLRNSGADANALITQRLQANQDARLEALRKIAGDPGQRDYFVADRQQAAQQLYDRAFSEVPTTTPWIQGQITQLQKRPAFMDALKQGQTQALNDGLELGPQNVVQTLHYTKLALDDMIAKAEGNEARSLVNTKNQLVSLLESKDFAPSYREARDTFAQMSKPINQMDVGTALYNKLQPALADFGASGRSTPQAFAQAVRDSGGTARRATGYGGATLENTLTPQQLASVHGVANDLGRSVNAAGLGLAPGSPTAQNLIGQDLLQRVLNPIGLPAGLIDNMFTKNFGARPLTWAYQSPEKKVMGLLGDAAVDPKEAKRLVELARKRGTVSRYSPYAAPAATAGLLDVQQ